MSSWRFATAAWPGWCLGGVDEVHTSKVRRGQSLVLWSALNAANYRQLIEYGFQDDGTITFRVGCSGVNYGSREWEANTQNIMWRVDVNFDGGKHDSVQVVEYVASEKLSTVTKMVERPFNGGREGGEDWKASKFTKLRVVNNERKNARGEKWAYELVPKREGNARLHGAREDWSLHDFWVTKARPKQDYYVRVPQYAEAAESIMDTDIVLWHNTPMVHDPSSEDGEMKGKSFDGATRVTWVGFDLRPRNFFDRTPLYP